MKGLATGTPTRAASASALQLGALAVCAVAASWYLLKDSDASNTRLHAPPANFREVLETCASLRSLPHVSKDFASTRVESDRFVPGTSAVWLRNATIWTGNTNEAVIYGGDVLLARGLIKFVGTPGLLDSVKAAELAAGLDEMTIVEVNGAWVTPGIVDLHSHMGVDSAPSLEGASDTNSVLGITQPWLRTLDAINTHDIAYELSMSGGVTTALVIPGSAGSIGGQGFTLKLRATAERSTFSKLVDPPFTYNGSGIIPADPPRWRHLKQACGENPSRVYGATRMDSIYALRTAYNAARQIKEKQDAFCIKAEAGLWADVHALGGEYPESLQWEALVDVLRGRVKVHTHCYEAVDFEGLVGLTNEFKFPLAAFHHAHEAYLVPGTLKRAFKSPPAIAMFATNARYKREAYRGSEFAPKILHEAGLRVVMKSDHPVLNSRYLLYEAQQAFFYGLPAEVALAAVTSTSASVLGLDHRLGSIRTGYDADLVIWDSHPLALGATPKQVYIDGISQLDKPTVHEKPEVYQKLPETPDFGDAAQQAVKYDGLPPLAPESDAGLIAFVNVGSVSGTSLNGDSNTVVVDGGRILCAGSCAMSANATRTIDLRGGALAHGLVSFGAPLGLEEISAEASTNDGSAPDALSNAIPELLGGDGFVAQAADGLTFGGRDVLLAYRAGVTHAISAQTSALGYEFVRGISTVFSLGASHRLERNAVPKREVALHILIERGMPQSVSTRIAALRRLLLGHGKGKLGDTFRVVAQGELPLVIDVASADIIATLLELKAEVEAKTGGKIRLILSRAQEAYLLAPQLAKAGVGVILNPSRPFPLVWSMTRMLPGAPLTEKTAAQVLHEHGVTVAIGIEESWSARNTRFDIAWTALESGGAITHSNALALASTNFEKLFGIELPKDLVAYAGGDVLSLSAKPVAIISSSKGCVDLF
ncbi:hypothetical protein BKA62DRAFT_348569 [Auriculariales sp. MPI-PUGE-AT-0066]|nr:hypothetical protein BKA62DRAFT_348569 [Auriculariales sp. MPI-PUGE-AT-0066]